MTAKRARNATKKRGQKAIKTAKSATCDKSQTARSSLSAQQELFCMLHVSGKSATKAYRQAYGNTKTAEAASSRLLTIVKIKARIEALQQEAAAGAVLTLQEKRKFLRRVVVTPIGEVNESSDLCQAAKLMTSDTGSTREIKMPCKLRAIELDAKLAGELRENPITIDSNGGDIFVLTPERMVELQKRRAAALGRK
jgi:hypothetical protein